MLSFCYGYGVKEEQIMRSWWVHVFGRSDRSNRGVFYWNGGEWKCKCRGEWKQEQIQLSEVCKDPEPWKWMYFMGIFQMTDAEKNRKSKVFNIYIILKSCKIGCNHWVCDILRAKKAEFRALRSVKGVSAKGTEKWGKRRIWGDMGLVYQTRNLFL